LEAVQIGSSFTEVPGRADIDPRISYPSYVPLDNFIDVERLRSLDGYIRERINAHIDRSNDPLFLNLHRLNKDSAYQPGVREIWLSRTLPGTPYNYLDLDRTELWQPTEAAEEFAELMQFIATLPFERTGRIILIYDDGQHSCEVPAHQDHTKTNICHEFIWMRTNLKKPFYVLDHMSGRKEYVSSYSAWFDTVNQFHGSDAADEMTFSIRVDGHFTDEFRSQIPWTDNNVASTPALWASLLKSSARFTHGGRQ